MFIFSTLIFWTLQLLFGYFLFLFFKCNQIYQTSFSTIKTTCLPSRKIRLLDEINNKRFTQKLYTGFKRERVFLNDRKQKLIFSFSQFYLSSVSSPRFIYGHVSCREGFDNSVWAWTHDFLRTQETSFREFSGTVLSLLY